MRHKTLTKVLISVVAISLLLSCTKREIPDKYGIIRGTLNNGATFLVKEDSKQPIVSISALAYTAEPKVEINKLLPKTFLQLGGYLTIDQTEEYTLYTAVLQKSNFEKGLKLFSKLNNELFVISIVGDIKKDLATTNLKNIFTAPDKTEVLIQKNADVSRNNSFQFSQTEDKRGTWATVTFQTPGISNDSRFPFYILNAWLKKEISTIVLQKKNSGEIQFILTPDEDIDLLIMEKILFKELNNIKKNGIPTDFITATRNLALLDQFRAQEEIQELSKTLVIEEFYGAYENALIKGYKIASVKLEDIKNIASNYFHINNVKIEEFLEQLPEENISKESRKKELKLLMDSENIKYVVNDDLVEIIPNHTSSEVVLKPKVLLINNHFPAIFQERHYFPLVTFSALVYNRQIYQSAEIKTTLAIALRSALPEVQQQIEVLGGRLNFVTNNDYIGFTIDILSTNLYKAIRILSKLIADPETTDNAINNEKARLIEELEDQKLLSPYSNSLQLALNAAYNNHPYIQPSFGTEAEIDSITNETVKTKLKTLFKTDDMVITVIGNFNTEELKTYLDKELKSLTKIPVTLQLEPKLFSIPDGITENIESNTPIPYSAATILFAGPTGKSHDFPAVILLTTLLNNFSFTKNTIAIPIWAKYLGAIAISKEVEGGNVKGIIKSIFKSINKIDEITITEKLFLASYLFILTKDLEKLQSNSAIADRLSTSWVIGGNLNYTKNLYKMLGSTTIGDVLKVIPKYLKSNNYVIGFSKSIFDNESEEKKEK